MRARVCGWVRSTAVVKGRKESRAAARARRRRKWIFRKAGETGARSTSEHPIGLRFSGSALCGRLLLQAAASVPLKASRRRVGRVLVVFLARAHRNNELVKLSKSPAANEILARVLAES